MAAVAEEQPAHELVPRFAAVELQLYAVTDRRVLQVPQVLAWSPSSATAAIAIGCQIAIVAGGAAVAHAI